MEKKKIIILITFIIIVILIIGFIVFSILNSKQEDNLNDQGTQNTLLSSNSLGNTNMVNSNTSNTNNLNEGSENMNNQSEEIRVNLIVNNKTFTATLNNNETVRELLEMFPMTLNMSDLNSNEKYNYLNTTLPTNTYRPNRINAGDIKLYGNNCLVVFYESFNTSYSYTDLGKVDNADEFVAELGSGSVSIRFELM